MKFQTTLILSPNSKFLIMNAISFNRKSLVLATLMALSLGLQAQIKSSHTDDKYANTTVVYKDSTTSDKDILNALGGDFGMSDVIRVTVAPPKPAPAPLIDKSKGQDIWLKPTNKAPQQLSASTSNRVMINAVSSNQVAQANKQDDFDTPNIVVAPAVQEKQAEKVQEEAAPLAVKTTKTVSSASHAKAGKSYKKTRKGYGKARMYKKSHKHFACPKF